MSAPENSSTWRFVRIGLLVTGEGERNFLEGLFRSLTESGHCTFRIIARVPQLSPRTLKAPSLNVTGTGARLPTRDQELGLRAKGFLLAQPDSYVILVDDLEHARREALRGIFARYRAALDGILGAAAWRASAFFLANMLEAYYFADTEVVNKVLGTNLADFAGDVEEIRHPKGEMRAHHSNFDEVRHGAKIVPLLRTPHVLSRPETCAHLRAMFSWCVHVIGDTSEARFCLDTGVHDVVTGQQLGRLGDASGLDVVSTAALG